MSRTASYPLPKNRRAIRLGTNLSRLMRKRPRLDADALRRELKSRGLSITKARLGSFINCTFKTISRPEIEALINWCHRRGDHFFVERAQPDVWETFRTGSPITVFLGMTEKGLKLQDDIEVLKRLLERIVASDAHPEQFGVRDQAVVLSAMKERNCIFIGSPRFNPATDIALTALAAAKVFGPSSRHLLPVRFANSTWRTVFDRYASVEPPRPPAQAGLWVQASDRSTQFLRIPWLPREDYSARRVFAFDAGLLVVARKPLKTSAHVTTIIVAGMTALATKAMAEDLQAGQVDFDDIALPVGRAATRIAVIPYRKPAMQEFGEPTKGREWLSIDRAIERWDELLRLRSRARVPKKRR
jgi:hypothetical protein